MNNLKTKKKIIPIALIALLSVAIISIVVLNTTHKDVAFASEATNASASNDAGLGNPSQITVWCWQHVGNKNVRPYTATFTWDAEQNGYKLEVETRKNNDGGVDVNEEFFNNIFTEVQKKGTTITKNSVVTLSLINGEDGFKRSWYGQLWSHTGAINGWANLKKFDSTPSSAHETICKFDTVDAYRYADDAKPWGRSAENAVICNCPKLNYVNICVKSTKDCLNNSWNYLISNCPQCDDIRIEDFANNFARPDVQFSNFNRVVSGVKDNCYVGVRSYMDCTKSSRYNKAEDRWPY